MWEQYLHDLKSFTVRECTLECEHSNTEYKTRAKGWSEAELLRCIALQLAPKMRAADSLMASMAGRAEISHFAVSGRVLIGLHMSSR